MIYLSDYLLQNLIQQLISRLKLIVNLLSTDYINLHDWSNFLEISEHKGMSADQTTGTASSYARKYALNGLLLLDDTKDADSDEFKRENDAKAKTAVMITPELLGQIKTELLRTGKEEAVVCNRYGAGCLEELTKAQAESALRGLRATK